MAKRRAPETKIFPTMSAFLAQDDRKSFTHFFVALKSSEQKHLASLTAFFAGMSDGKTFSCIPLASRSFTEKAIHHLESTPVYCQRCFNNIVLCPKVAAHN